MLFTTAVILLTLYVVTDKKTLNNQTGDNNNNSENNNYKLQDFIGEYKFSAGLSEVCDEEIIFRLELSSDNSFRLHYPGACAGALSTVGFFNFENDEFTLKPTHFVGHDDISYPIEDEYSDYKDVSIKINNKDSLTLDIHNKSTSIKWNCVRKTILKELWYG